MLFADETETRDHFNVNTVAETKSQRKLLLPQSQKKELYHCNTILNF